MVIVDSPGDSAQELLLAVVGSERVEGAGALAELGGNGAPGVGAMAGDGAVEQELLLRPPWQGCLFLWKVGFRHVFKKVGSRG